MSEVEQRKKGPQWPPSSSWTITPIEGESKAQRAYTEAMRRKRLQAIEQKQREEEVRRNQPIKVNPVIAFFVIVIFSYIGLRFNDLDISCTKIESGVSCVLVARDIDGKEIEEVVHPKPTHPKWEF